MTDRTRRLWLSALVMVSFAAPVLAAPPHPAGEPELEVTPGQAHPGDAVMITVRRLPASKDHQCPPLWLGDRALEAFPIPGACRALLGLPVEQPAGTLDVRVGAPDHTVGELEVLPPAFNVRELTVERKFVEPSPAAQKQLKADQAAFDHAYSQPFGPLVIADNFRWPIKSRITAPYGDLRTFNGKKQSQHYGTDLDGRKGDPIYAANDGVVVMARRTYAAGNATVISHGGGLYTAYFHQTKMLVKPGDKVKKGQQIGTVGRTGRVTGPHLHFSVKINGLYVDPASLLRLDFGAGPERIRADRRVSEP